MAAEHNDFNINLGDTIYSDSELSGSKPALTVPAKWQKYRYGLALPNLRALRASAGLYSHPDDHEFVNDFSVSGGRRRAVPGGRQSVHRLRPCLLERRAGLLPEVSLGEASRALLPGRALVSEREGFAAVR